MKIWGHRGASAYAPENTMEAFKLAVEMKADGVETDVHLTKDNVLVLMHDESVNRTTNGKGFIKDYTYDQLTKLNANYGNEKYPFCQVPKLADLLQLAKDTGILLNIEVKTDYFLYEGIEQLVLDLVKEYGVEDQVMYSSFNHYTLLKMKEIDPSIRVGLLYMAGMYQPWIYANAIHCEALHPVFPACFLDDYVANCHKNNIMVNTWTVNRKEDIEWFMEQDVDGIITDDPKLAKALRDGE